MAVRFLAGPAVMAVASVAVGLRGTLLRIAIVQVRTYVSPAGQSVPNLVSRFYVTCCYVGGSATGDRAVRVRQGVQSPCRRSLHRVSHSTTISFFSQLECGSIFTN
jgi:hypothetical protein